MSNAMGSLQLLQYVIWPSQVKSLAKHDFISIARKREVLTDGEGIAGTFYSEKMQREIQYESKLEMEFLLRLEKFDTVVLYQEQPFAVPYKKTDKEYIYYPDIFVLLRDARGFLVEIKPIFKMALHTNLAKWTGLRKFCETEGLGLLVTDGRYSIQQIQHQPIRKEFEETMLLQLKNGKLSWQEYKTIRDKYHVKRSEFLALILKHRLIWSLNPFTLAEP